MDEPESGHPTPASRNHVARRAAGWVTEHIVAVGGAGIISGVGTALVVTWLVGPDGGRTQALSAPRQTQLEVVDLAVRNDGEGPPEIDVTLKNGGNLVSVVKGATFRILRYEAIEHGRRCYQGGEPLPAGKRYRLALPLDDVEGQEVTVKLTRELRANEADRFAFKVSLASDRYVDRVFLGPSRLVQLEVLLEHDSNAEPLLAGRVLLAVPFPRVFLFGFPESWGDPGPCETGNVERLVTFLELEGVRSDELQAFADAAEAGTLFTDDQMTSR
ncbi:MAG TPA: hypothetical protein VFR63_06300 [Gaiellaceae bacterium]|nr:hypothetical protein [Gaiellaceae bacterium]